ncbi:MAG: monooxygenase [Planctomycetes bacterium]|nr:monooxygenase [Planctomycetota bacterium]
MPKSDLPRIAILGAGPIGLEAALYARKLEYPVDLYERGQIADYWQRWGHVKLFSPFGMNSTPLGRAAIRAANPDHEFPAEDACITGREHRNAYLVPLSKLEIIKNCLHLETQVLAVGRHGYLKDDDPGDPKRARQPFRLLVRDNQKKERNEEADIVLDCTGTFGQHRWLGDGGIPASGEAAAENSIMYWLEDLGSERKKHYLGKTTLVVGSGYSAATTVCGLSALFAENPATWVIWLARSNRTQPLARVVDDSLRERDRLAVKANTLATRTDDNVEYHASSVIDRVEFLGQDRGFRVGGGVAGKAKTWEVDLIIGNVGYSPDTSIYRELHVHECYASLGPMKLAAALQEQKGHDCLKVSGGGADNLRNPEANFYILGAKSHGRNSNFLLRAGFEQVRDVFAMISGNSGLDLFKKK